ncbi:hypothetical protein Taro_041087 [Colocasia esculenta]|uniref:BAG domain-containing protein n=1 Tax=Colocasia esculenta TaxID=4460 RepID=A0A843WZS3_COLES|nr:hypothetical protein [Colocasia esculenta]
MLPHPNPESPHFIGVCGVRSSHVFERIRTHSRNAITNSACLDRRVKSFDLPLLPLSAPIFTNLTPSSSFCPTATHFLLLLPHASTAFSAVCSPPLPLLWNPLQNPRNPSSGGPSMSWFRRMELLDSPSASLFLDEAAFCKPRPFPFSTSFLDEPEQLELALDILGPPSVVDVPIRSFLSRPAPSHVDFFESAADLLQIGSAAAYGASLRRLQERAEAEVCLRSLCDRVAALEVGFDRAMLAPAPRDRKYKWTTEIKEADGADRKYKWETEVKAGGERNLKWTAEIGGKVKNSPTSRTYTFQASTAPAAAKKVEVPVKVRKAKKGGEAKASSTRVVEITDGSDQGAVVLRQAFTRRAVVSKGKRKELSPQDAALLIQICFREHLVRRSQVLRCLRDLAVAKAKLREIRSLFYNFSYRHRVAKDAEERQRFSEKIIVLLLTVDAIEGPDYMVRAARKSMVDELEAMLEVVDPQPPGSLGYLKRRKFDLPDGGVCHEMARGVAEVVQLLNEGENSAA